MLPSLINNSLINNSLRNGFTDSRPANRLAPLFDSVFDDFFGPSALRGWQGMPMSVEEDENHFYLEFDAPGVNSEDIDVSVHDRELIIRGERKSEQKEGRYDTRSYGRFEQRLTLPVPVNMDQIEAKLDRGVLHLTLPKSEAAKPRKIAVKSA